MVDFTPASIASDISYGLGLLNSFGAKVDVVGIYQASPFGPAQPTSFGSSVINSLLGQSNVTPAFGQLFAKARPMDATVRETSQIMRHPIETGSMIADHKIINPVQIDITLIIQAEDYASTYTQIRQAWANSLLLNVKTRTGVYQNMVIADIPHKEDSEMFNAITVGLRLEEAQFFTPGNATLQSNFKPLDPVDASTVQSGLQQAVALGSRLLSTATSVASYASAFKKGFL